MEGLEAKEILKSKALSITGEERWDSDYYKKLFLENESIINNMQSIKFTNLCSFIKKGIFDLPPSNYLNKGVPFVRTSEIKNPTLDFNSIVYISSKVNLENDKTVLNPFDLVFTKIGAYIGDVAMLPTLFNEYNFSQNVAGAKLINADDGPYILAFFLSSFGKKQILRSIMISGQGKLELDDIRNYKIPNFSNDFKIAIRKIFKHRELIVLESFNTYSQAENILLETIGLNNFKPSTDTINIKNFKDSFLTTGRLDSEFYQKKYEDYNKLIRNYKNGYETLKVSCKQKDDNFIPADKTEYKYIELADIGNTGDIKGCTFAQGIELPTRARRKVNTNDVIISSIEGSLESCALVTEEYNEALCSTGFYVINSKKINSETLLVLFKSDPMQNILKQNCSGTILTAINKYEFHNIPVPLIDKEVQLKIKENISESFSLKKQSEHLLETAKRAVEIAIEQNEQKALEFIKSTLNDNLNI